MRSNADGLVGSFNVSNNFVNPSEGDILQAGPCDPADTIGDLLDDGTINQGQANALTRLAEKNLGALANLLSAFVNAGILTESEAQLLLVIASL